MTLFGLGIGCELFRRLPFVFFFEQNGHIVGEKV